MRVVKVRQRRGGRPRLYGAELQRVLVNFWRRFGCLWGKRLAPILRRCLPSIAVTDSCVPLPRRVSR
jgi:hypothetical protein